MIGVMISFLFDNSIDTYGNIVSIKEDSAYITYVNPLTRKIETKLIELIKLTKIGSHPKIIKDKI